MKKLIIFLTMVMAVATATSLNATMDSSVMNKGSTITMNTVMPSTSGNYMVATVTPNAWVQQNSSINSTVSILGVVVMNNTQNLMWKDVRSKTTQSSLMISNSMPEHGQILETCAEVNKIPNFSSMVMNSSNAQMSQTGTKWRQNFADLMTNITVSRITNGANVCNVKKSNSCSFSFGSLWTGAV